MGAILLGFTAYSAFLRVQHRRKEPQNEEEEDNTQRTQLIQFKATLKNANYEKLVENSGLFAATKKTVAAALSMKTPGCQVDVELHPGSVKI